jgi:predicted transcriptional regulator
MSNLPRPTPAELEILRVLWERGPSTVREVQEVLTRDRPTGYTTALKLLQIMAEKKLVSRDEAARAHVYSARVPERSAGPRLRRLGAQARDARVVVAQGITRGAGEHSRDAGSHGKR